MFVCGELKLFLKGRENKIFDVSNLGGELVCIFVICFCLFIFYLLLFSTHAFMVCLVFQEFTG